MKRSLVLSAGAIGGLVLSAVAAIGAFAWHGDTITARVDCTNQVLVVTGIDAANGYHFGKGHGTLVLSNGATYPWTFSHKGGNPHVSTQVIAVVPGSVVGTARSIWLAEDSAVQTTFDWACSTPTPTPSAHPTPTPSAYPTPTPTAYPTPTPTEKPTPTPTEKPTPTPTEYPTPTPTEKPTPTPTEKPTPMPTEKPTPTPTEHPTPTPPPPAYPTPQPPPPTAPP